MTALFVLTTVAHMAAQKVQFSAEKNQFSAKKLTV